MSAKKANRCQWTPTLKFHYPLPSSGILMPLQVQQDGYRATPNGKKSTNKQKNSPPHQLICSSGGGRINNLYQPLAQTAQREGKKEEMK